MGARLPDLERKRSQRGFGMVELMVGLVIGIISVLVVYQVYTVSEGFKRNTTAAGEAQQTGLFSMFTLGLDLANAGAGVVPESPNLASCSDPGGAMPMRYAKTYRPLPVVVADSGSDNIADTFVLSYSSSTTLAAAAFITPNPGFPVAGAPFLVQSPGGFHQNDLVVIIPNPGSPTGITPCGTAKITAAPALTNDVQGDALLTEAPVDPAGGIDLSGFGGPLLLNMGPCDRVQKIMYSLKAGTWDNKPRCDQGTPCALYAKPLLDTSAGNCGKPANVAASPIAMNIVNMKVQYGIDTDIDIYRTLDTWAPASAAANGDWTWQTMMSDAMLISKNGAQNGINQIRAVRIGVIVQSDQFDQTLGDYNWVLFDCSNANKALCPGRLTGTIAAQISPAGNWRFRTYETVIPLRSAIWQRF